MRLSVADLRLVKIDFDQSQNRTKCIGRLVPNGRRGTRQAGWAGLRPPTYKEGENMMSSTRIMASLAAAVAGLAFAAQAHAGTVDVYFHKPVGINITHVQIRLIGSPSTCLVDSGSPAATCKIADVFVPSTRLFRFEWVRNQTDPLQVMYAWIRLEGAFADIDVDIPAHNVTFNGDGYPAVSIGGIPARLAESSAQNSRLNQKFDDHIQIAFVGAVGTATVAMLDGCYSVYAAPYSACPGNSCVKVWLEHPLCVGGEPGDATPIVVDFDAP